MKNQLKEKQPPESKIAKLISGQSPAKPVVNVKWVLVVLKVEGKPGNWEWQFPPGYDKDCTYSDVYCLEISLPERNFNFLTKILTEYDALRDISETLFLFYTALFHSFTTVVDKESPPVCVVTSANGNLIASHLLPKRLGKEGIKAVMSTFAPLQLAATDDIYDSTFGLLLVSGVC